ncbi:MAG: NADH-quinone oxidoreductase subunit NuoK [Dehalococcoidia bacterium]
MSVDLEHYLIVSALLFSIGMYVTLAKQSFIGVLIGIEMMFNAVNLTFISFARFVESGDPLAGHVFVIFTITVSAAGAATALALAVLLYRVKGTIEMERMDLLKW